MCECVGLCGSTVLWPRTHPAMWATVYSCGHGMSEWASGHKCGRNTYRICGHTTLSHSLTNLVTVTIEPNVVWNCLSRDPPNNQPDHTCLCVITCVFTRAGLMGLSRTTLQRTLGPCQMVEQRCSNKCPPEFIFRWGAQAARLYRLSPSIGFYYPIA